MNRIRALWTNLRSSLWFLPGLMIAASIALALILIEIDSRIKTEWLAYYPRLFGLGADGSRGMLTAIASSMLTVATLAFSLTINAITQASGQFTPRIFRNFMRDRANQFVLGYFVSVFVYCLLVLRTIRGGDELKFVPSVAVLVGLASAVGGVLVLIFFIHHIADSLQITTILKKITDETLKAVEKLFPENLGDAASEEEKHEAWRKDEKQIWTRIPAAEAGYIQNVEIDELLKYAAENQLLIHLKLGIGQFASGDATLAEITPESQTSAKKSDYNEQTIEEIRGFFAVNRHRTIEQDAGFGIRQIVDIALKALSPGINDTTTAINCIDHLGEIAGSLAARQLPARVRSQNGVPRIIVVAPNFRDYIEEAFDQIRVSGKANTAIYERLISTLIYISERTSSSFRRGIIRDQIQLVAEAAEKTLETEHEKGKVRTKLDEIGKS